MAGIALSSYTVLMCLPYFGMERKKPVSLAAVIVGVLLTLLLVGGAYFGAYRFLVEMFKRSIQQLMP